MSRKQHYFVRRLESWRETPQIRKKNSNFAVFEITNNFTVGIQFLAHRLDSSSAISSSPGAGPSAPVQHHVVTTVPTVFGSPLRLMGELLVTAKQHFDLLLHQSTIRPFSNQWASPLHLIKKESFTEFLRTIDDSTPSPYQIGTPFPELRTCSSAYMVFGSFPNWT